jgi:putative ubiquitin-RnfH superfamily antitoxin RatB of RatAB toxin-antitoxin module
LNSSIVSWGSTVTVNIENIINAQIALDVYSLTGAAVYSSSITEPTTQINLSELPIGYYVASVKSGSTMNDKKIFIGR